MTIITKKAKGLSSIALIALASFALVYYYNSVALSGEFQRAGVEDQKTALVQQRQADALLTFQNAFDDALEDAYYAVCSCSAASYLNFETTGLKNKLDTYLQNAASLLSYNGITVSYSPVSLIFKTSSGSCNNQNLEVIATSTITSTGYSSTASKQVVFSRKTALSYSGAPPNPAIVVSINNTQQTRLSITCP
jgi:hypothetical protein